MSGAFGETLQYITSIKLQELARQRSACRTYVDSALRDAAAAATPLERVLVLYDRITSWKGLGSLVSDEISLPNYAQWGLQAENDPSIPESLVKTWGDTLEQQLRQTVTRYDYAQLFGDLLKEWLGSGDSLALPTAAPVEVAEDSAPPPTSATGPERTMRQERVEQQDRIQELIFSPKNINIAALKTYLWRLFSGEDGAAVLAALRDRVKKAGASIRSNKVTMAELRKLMQSLLSRDLLSAEKTATLKGFIGNDVIVQEIATVLNMQMAGLGEWDWPEDGVPMDMRRHLSGKYRAYMDSEIIQALLFQHIGMQWSIRFKSIFGEVVDSRAWKRDVTPQSKKQLERRQEFLQEIVVGMGARGAGVAHDHRNPLPESIEAQRRALQREKFFLTQLPAEIAAEDPYDEEPSATSEPNQGVQAQQVLLRLVSTEIALKQQLHGQCTVVRADLEWFGPSLSHDAILTAFEFYGMDDGWMSFFRKWLQAKLRFEGSTAPQTRKRGVPIAQALSVLCGEVLLFGMDFAANQAARGLYIYRIYDDFWFFHHEASRCATAWKEMNTYANLCGITFNAKKTGAVCVGAELEPSLPRGPVGWGFISLDASQGRFVVDQTTIDTHIAELKRQLVNTKSVFGFVNVFNKYVEWMRRNFAQPANCFGTPHADEVISTFGRIYREVFVNANGSVVQHLQTVLQERFGITDIPSGWVFLPTAAGGLGVVNPIIDILVTRKALSSPPSETIADRMRNDKIEYDGKWDAWHAASTASGGSDDFMTWEEYILGRETAMKSWGTAWKSMQEVPEPKATLQRRGAAAVNDDDWYDRPWPEKWVVSLYGDELVKKFGSLQTVELTLIPVGLLSTFRSSKVAWDS
ncbi:hypothetical protein AURDEDRAFT_186615 [Auricularia subglabra TFB-10046 SS5]|nr:hypothetical protein AURDEDRAFT_186615 [Auricularia subglabra TFB-10046 SS5]